MTSRDLDRFVACSHLPGDGTTRGRRLRPLTFPFDTVLTTSKHGTQHVQVGFYLVSTLDTRRVLGRFLLPDEVNNGHFDNSAVAIMV